MLPLRTFHLYVAIFHKHCSGVPEQRFAEVTFVIISKACHHNMLFAPLEQPDFVKTGK